MSQYLLFATLCQAGYDATRVSQALDVLEGRASIVRPDEADDEYHPEPEPYEPSPEDWADYELYLERRDVEESCNARFHA
jgi:hypothetical protein